MAEQFNARLEPDYAERAKAYMEERGLRKGQAARRLMQAGIDAIDEREDSSAMLERVAMALAVAGLVAFLATFATWAYFEWALVEPVIIAGVLTAAYLGAGWTVTRYGRRRSA